DITGDSNIKMSYTKFHELIVERHKVDIQGWPAELKFVNPSELSDKMAPLQNLFDALTNGACKFIKLSANEVKAWRDRLAADVAAGKVAPRKPRKQRKDAG
ncbi:hypothetical protein BC835DRAFT_1254788, partial [Cytidiella melzeri]